MSSLRKRLLRQLGSTEPTGREGRERDTQDSNPGPGLRVIDQLRRLHQSRPPAPPRPRPRLRAPVLPQTTSPVTEPPALVRREVERAGSSFLHGELRFPARHSHGLLELGRALEVRGPQARLLAGDPALADFEVQHAAFFDLETTGLLGGAGNLAFVLGLARMEASGELVLHQLVLRHPSEEAGALALFEELLEDVRFLVSFNGKSFDRNVLADRLTMHRRPADWVLELPHLDLLHPARRLFRSLLPSCSLSALEEGRLGVHRHAEEVRGAEVPERWFSYLRSGRSELIEPVLDHNSLDILSLVTLTTHLADCLKSPDLFLPEPRGQVAAARLFAERGARPRGEAILKRLSEGDPEDPGVYAALSLYGEQLRRQQRYSEALPLWRRMMDCAGPQDLHPWRAAAVALEHRLGRLEEALQLVEELFALLEDGPGTRLHDPEELRELKKRRDRLLRRAGSDPGSRARPSSPGRGDCGA